MEEQFVDAALASNYQLESQQEDMAAVVVAVPEDHAPAVDAHEDEKIDAMNVAIAVISRAIVVAVAQDDAGKFSSYLCLFQDIKEVTSTEIGC